MYYTYILHSKAFDKYYIGQTNHFKNRIEKHNNGYVSSTKPYIPWTSVLIIEKETRAEAMALEKKLKNLNRSRLELFIEKYL